MPLLTEASAVGAITGIVPAAPGWRVEVSAPPDSDVSGVAVPSDVVAWALVGDEAELGGARVDPVFLADGRAFTPDQFRAAYGQQLTVRVAPVR